MALTSELRRRRAAGVTAPAGSAIGGLPGRVARAAGAADTASDRVAAFVKSGRREAIEREAEVLAHVDRLSRGGTSLAPAPLAADRREGVLVVEALDGWASLHDLFGRDVRRDFSLARALGACLARLHALAPGALAPAVDHVPRLELGPREAAELTGAMLELIGQLQRACGLEAALDDLRAMTSPTALIHGDTKLDNVLADNGADNIVRLVDFEHSGAGDPAWDVGAAVGDYVSRWLLSVRVSQTDGVAAWLRDATVPRSRCAAAARAVLAGYELARPLPDRDRVAACAGVFLLHRAQAWVERYGVLSAKPTLLARCGARLAVARWGVLAPLLEVRS